MEFVLLTSVGIAAEDLQSIEQDATMSDGTESSSQSNRVILVLSLATSSEDDDSAAAQGSSFADSHLMTPLDCEDNYEPRADEQ
ncbi:uncharacterized protein N7484_009592 [Penicillium longicatenatum]|uniref:uncharacterized protein n=1 Tax=Penicillium longicatenatum TaxID=1561947 RepID=UPI002546BAC8|nr:uncharacterized protein N7484_009592 [Penicillium longicatenatum]KAJ5636279.1 hypothetical protein N7484_009592 [Penicillium longicatenatum]